FLHQMDPKEQLEDLCGLTSYHPAHPSLYRDIISQKRVLVKKKRDLIAIKRFHYLECVII
ncbi:MAG: hypothetical protein RBR46_01490, partial [Acholeplasmatales bacterium]|nr:hypothetical protein [Acholeplasmatales bacterium]